MTLRGNDLLLTVLGLLAIGLAGTKASAQIPNGQSCQNYQSCQGLTCTAVNGGTCAPLGGGQNLPYDHISQASLLSYGSCLQSVPQNNCVMVNKGAVCNIIRYHLTPQKRFCNGMTQVCFEQSFAIGC